MSDSAGKAVFLSYASQDAEAARRICEALSKTGIECWLDQSELRGGDAWDQKIRKQIRACALFIPVISAATQARREGYFRLEWHLADQRSLLMASGTPFIVPVGIDGTRDGDALVPDSFRTVQWMRAPEGRMPDACVLRIAALVRGADEREPAAEPMPGVRGSAPAGTRVPRAAGRGTRWRVAALVCLAMVAGLAAYMGLRKGIASPTMSAAPTTAPAPVTVPVMAAPPTRPSEARQVAERAFAMSVDAYGSTADDFSTADGLVKQALELDSNDGEIWAIAAQLNLMYRNRGFDYSPAPVAAGRQQAERAVRLAPKSAEALFALGLSQRYTTRDQVAAGDLFKRALAVNPGHARALMALGEILIQSGRNAEGMALLEQARSQPKWAPLASYYEFLVYFDQRKFEEADRAVRSSFAAGPSENSAGGIALVHLTWKGGLDEAIHDLQTVPRALLGAPRVVLFTAEVQMFRRAPDEALTALDRIPEDFIHDSFFIGPKNYLVGRVHALAHRPGAARVAWESGLAVMDARLKSANIDPDLHLMRGALLAYLRRGEEAIGEARTVEEMIHGRPVAWYHSPVMIYAALGRADLAVPILAALLDSRESLAWPLTQTLLRLDPLWDPLRHDPGFLSLMETSVSAPTQ